MVGRERDVDAKNCFGDDEAVFFFQRGAHGPGGDFIKLKPHLPDEDRDDQRKNKREGEVADMVPGRFLNVILGSSSTFFAASALFPCRFLAWPLEE